MRFDRLLPALFALWGAVSAQTFSGLTFDGRGEVSLVWASDGEPGRYDFYLCAGDESTESYVSIWCLALSQYDRLITVDLYRNLWDESSRTVSLHPATWFRFELILVWEGVTFMHSTDRRSTSFNL